jgi:hypothetical protein
MKPKMRRLALRAASIVLVALAAGPSIGAEKKIVLDAKIGEIVSNSIVRPPAPEGTEAPEFGQEVRVDKATSADPDWKDATLMLYEQSVALESSGTFRSYGIATASGGDTLLVQLSGKWNVINHDGQTEAPFTAEGKLLGGTGKFKGIDGTVAVKGKSTGKGAGVYTVEITTTNEPAQSGSSSPQKP